MQDSNQKIFSIDAHGIFIPGDRWQGRERFKTVIMGFVENIYNNNVLGGVCRSRREG